MLVLGTLLPLTARASVLSDLIGSIKRVGSFVVGFSNTTPSLDNLQTMDVLEPAMNLNPAPATGGGDITIVDNSALMPEEGPSGTIADIEKPKVATVTTYIVQPGDTLSGIAKMFQVSQGTILYANDLRSGAALQVGQKLVILPIDSIPYTVKKGDTVESIAKRFNGDVAEIESFNGVDNATLAAGQQILIPNGEATVASTATAPSKKTASTGKTSTVKGATGPSSIFANNPKEPAHDIGATGTLAEVDYYIAPLSHYVRTQGIHGYNAVDLAAPSGTPIMAAATGDVVVARAGGWNGGYGSYVVINHPNGSQTLYAHMSKVSVYDGEHVVQGEVIGYVGSTGQATGPHVHFEIRDGIRNPF